MKRDLSTYYMVTFYPSSDTCLLGNNEKSITCYSDSPQKLYTSYIENNAGINLYQAKQEYRYKGIIQLLHENQKINVQAVESRIKALKKNPNRIHHRENKWLHDCYIV